MKCVPLYIKSNGPPHRQRQPELISSFSTYFLMHALEKTAASFLIIKRWQGERVRNNMVNIAALQQIRLEHISVTSSLMPQRSDACSELITCQPCSWRKTEQTWFILLLISTNLALMGEVGSNSERVLGISVSPLRVLPCLHGGPCPTDPPQSL